MGYQAKDVDGFTELVDITLAKKQCKELPQDIEDDLLQKYIVGARKAVERKSEKVLVDKSVEVYVDAFPSENGKIYLPFPTEEAEIIQIDYEDFNGNALQIDGADVYLANIPQPNFIEPKTDNWPTDAKRIVISYVASAHDDDVDALLPAVLLAITHFYMNRGIVEISSNTNIMNVIKMSRRYTAL
tara:strand:+ start:692 stop:1249 length:558 start_codon:yes stop_codon:yes gene_type:complete